jgi:hypothetical protein
VRLAGGALAGVSVVTEIKDLRHGTDADPVPRRGRWNGRTLEYAGAAKYLTTVLQVTLAGIARERSSGRRLTWLWSDQGVWLSALRDGDTQRLNAVLGPAVGEGWEWVDQQPPKAAGEMYPVAER